MNAASTRRCAIAVVLSALLLTSGVVSGVPSGSDEAGSHGSERLVATDCVPHCVVQFDTAGARNHTQSVGPNAGAVLTLRHDRLDDRLDALATRERGEMADNETAALATEFDALRAGTDRLEAAQDAALQAYDDRNVTAEELVIELVRIDATARRLDKRRVAAAGRLDDLTAVDVDIRTLRADLLSLQGPVRQYSLGQFTGEREQGIVAVEASSDYVALATTTDRRSVVERYQANYRERPSDGPATIESAADLVADHYPVEWGNRTGYTIRQLDADLLYVELEHTEGTVVAYIDRPTARVFKEFQYTPLPAAAARRWTDTDR